MAITRCAPDASVSTKRAVIAAGDDALAVGRAARMRAGVDGDALLAVLAGEQQRLLAQHEHRRLAKEMHADDGAAGVHRADAVGERGKRGGGVGHQASYTSAVIARESGQSSNHGRLLLTATPRLVRGGR